MTISQKINQAINRVSNAMEAMAAEKVERIYESRIGRELDRKSNAKYDRKRKHTELTHTPFTAHAVIKVGELSMPITIPFEHYDVAVTTDNNFVVYNETALALFGIVYDVDEQGQNICYVPSNPRYVKLNCADGSQMLFRNTKADRPKEFINHIPSHGYCDNNISWHS